MTQDMQVPTRLPLAGIKVIDLGHTVMGPSCAMILADLGADVIKVEPSPGGDPTRKLKGFGTGYFGYFNRNKRSIAIDLKSEEGLEVMHGLLKEADILIENFGPGTMARLKLDYESISPSYPRLIFASLKGFLPGPYENRLALDEVVQMMTGLAYMTGPTGRPLRAGTSVVDITGGMFAVIAIMSALRQRDMTGSGQKIESALFETTVFLMGQHLCYAAQSDGPLPPMPERVSAWAVYETFAVSDGRQIFVGMTSDSHWKRFCDQVQRPDLEQNPAFATNNARIDARPQLLPIVQQIFAAMTLEQAIEVCENASIPFAPIARPEDLFDDPHLRATGGLIETQLPDGTPARLPRLPITMENADFGLRRDPPSIGQDTQAILAEIGFSDERIRGLLDSGVVGARPRSQA